MKGLELKILSKSVQLFNEFGLANVSPNKIAQILGISVGNLTYYYRTKEDLVDAICDQMYMESKSYMDIFSLPSLQDFRTTLIKFRELQIAYSFIFDDMVFICKKYPKIGDKLRKISQQRLKQGHELVEFYIKTGRLLPEGKDFNYKYFIHTVWLISTFWSSQGAIQILTKENKSSYEAVDIIWYMLKPYLTLKGLEEYTEINVFEKISNQ